MIVPLDAKSFLVLKKLLVSNTYLNANQLASDLDISKRSVYYAITRINDFLLNAGIAQIEMERRLGILLHDNHKKQIERCLDQNVEADTYVLSPMERVRYIICFLLYTSQNVFIDELTTRMKVSRNTVFNDLKVVESKLLRYELNITFNQKDGYKIVGDQINKRAIFLYNIQVLLPLYNSGIIEFSEKKRINIFYYLLKKIEETLNVKYVSGTLLSLSILVKSYVDRQEEISFPDLDPSEIRDTKEFKLVKEYLPMLIGSEQYYLTLHLLGARLQVVPIFNKSAAYDREIYYTANDLKMEFERLACITFENDNELLEALYAHLKTSMFRYKYGIVLENPLAEEIMKNYNELFTLTKKACDYLQKQIGIPISDEEIAYIALHFGSFLKHRQVKLLRILIVCPNGVATGNMLKREINQLIPNAGLLDVQASSNIENIYSQYDLIISTIQVISDVPSIVVHPILTDNDRLMILNYASSMLGKSSRNIYDPEDIFLTFKQFVKEEDEERFKNALFTYFSDNDQALYQKKLGIVNVLTPSRICFFETDDWREAIRLSSQPLIKLGRIKNNYVEKMIGEVENYGPYNFITEGVVLAHAKPIDEDSKLDISFGISKKGVAFSKKKIAHIIVVLSVEQEETHLNILKDIMTLFGVQTHMDQIIRLDQEQKIFDFIKMQLID